MQLLQKCKQARLKDRREVLAFPGAMRPGQIRPDVRPQLPGAVPAWHPGVTRVVTGERRNDPRCDRLQVCSRGFALRRLHGDIEHLADQGGEHLGRAQIVRT